MARSVLVFLAVLGLGCGPAAPPPSAEPNRASASASAPAAVVVEVENEVAPGPACAAVDPAGLAHLYPAEFTRVTEVGTGIEREVILVDGGVSPASEGRYLLLDGKGPLSLATVVRQGGEGPVQVELERVGDWLREPPPRPGGSWSHQVVVGPVEGPLPCAKLMFFGLARAGASAEREPEPGTRALPDPDNEPYYLVDLDGDEAADLVLYTSGSERSFGDEVLIKWSSETWVFREDAWAKLDEARWETRDYYGDL